MSWNPSDPLYLAVCGNPAAHSRSPEIFSLLLDRAGLRGCYLRFTAESPEEIFDFAENLPLRGFNVTAPFKQAVMPFLSGLDDAARRIGAVNAVHRAGRGWVGANTDFHGVTGALLDHGFDPAGRDIVVLGAGGAGRAAAYGLIRAGAGRVTMVNRTRDRAREAARGLGCREAPWSDLGRCLARADGLVACLPAGNSGVPEEGLRPEITVLDAEYRQGSIAELARRRGCRVIDGKDWLLRQALPCFRLFTGGDPPDSTLPELRERLGAPPPGRGPHTALIGFMGAGKSTVAQRLAKLHGARLVDSDLEVEKQAGLSIPEIFAARGEAAFRKLEGDLIRRELANPRPALFALGGGAILDPETREAVRRSCRVVWLWIPSATALRRFDPATRPLIEAGSAGKSRAAGILKRRTPLYAGLADLVIGSERPGIHRIAERISNETDLSLTN
jgi:shikimate dehydrogenase